MCKKLLIIHYFFRHIKLENKSTKALKRSKMTWVILLCERQRKLSLTVLSKQESVLSLISES